MPTAQHGAHPIASGRGGIALDGARHDPAKIDDFRAGGNRLFCLGQRIDRKPRLFGKQQGISLRAAGVSGVDDRVHKIVLSKSKRGADHRRRGQHRVSASG